MKYIFYIITLVFCTILFSNFSCHNDHDPLQYNDWIEGKWQFENSNEYIQFFPNDMFIMNDTITGNYDIEDATDKHIWFYCINDNEDIEEDGFFDVLDIKYKKSLTIKNLPRHEGETHKIIYK